MDIEFDSAKNARNITKHGIDLGMAACFDLATAVIEPDVRKDYREDRFIATGLIGERVHVLIFTPRAETLRAISLRKANARERRDYEEEQDL